MKSAVALTRRSLFGLAALGLAGCKAGSSPPAPRVDPDAAALASARAAEADLLARYDTQIAGATGDTADLLSSRRAAHAAHLAALGGTPAPAPGIGTAAAQPFGTIDRDLRKSSESLRAAALAAVDGKHAALLASVAASHEVMAGV